MSVIKLSIQKASVSAKLFSSPLHLHIRSSQCLPGHLSLRRRISPYSPSLPQRFKGMWRWLTARMTFVTLTFTTASFPPLSQHPSSAHASWLPPRAPHRHFQLPRAGTVRLLQESAGRSLGPVLAGPRGGQGPSGCGAGTGGTPQAAGVAPERPLRIWGWHQRDPSGCGAGTAGTARGPLGAWAPSST